MSGKSTKRDRVSPAAQGGSPDKPGRKRTHRLRTVLLLGFVGLWLGILVTWIALSDPGAWGDWLVNLEFSEMGSKLTGGRDKHRVKDPSELTSFGDGKFELGDFSVRIFDPINRTTLRSDFHLEGNTIFDDEDGFQDFMQSNHRQFREQIMVAVRNCDVEELADPDLRLLEKKLAARVNRAMDRPILKSVRIGNLTLYESASNVFVPMDNSNR